MQFCFVYKCSGSTDPAPNPALLEFAIVVILVPINRRLFFYSAKVSIFSPSKVILYATRPLFLLKSMLFGSLGQGMYKKSFHAGYLPQSAGQDEVGRVDANHQFIK